jgi:MFS family permease
MNEAQTANDAGVPQGISLVLGSTLGVFGVAAVAPVLPALMTAFQHVPNAGFWVPALMTAPGLGAALLSPVMGLIGDLYGYRTPLIFFCAFFALAGALPLVLSDFTAIFVSRLFVGISLIGVVVLSTALIGEYFTGARRDRWLTTQTVVATGSTMVILPIAGFLGAELGWRGPFLMFLSALPLALAYAIYLKKPAASADSIGHEAAPWSALPWRWLGRFCLMTFGISVLIFTVQFQIGLALATIGVTDVAQIGMLSAIACIGVPFGAMLFWKLGHLSFSTLLTGELIVAGTTLMILPLAGSKEMFVAIAFVHLVACGLMLPTVVTHLVKNLDGPVRARGIGIFQSATMLGQFMSVGLIGFVLRRPGATVLDAFWILGLVVLAAAILTLLVLLLRKTRSNPAAVQVGQA